MFKDYGVHNGFKYILGLIAGSADRLVFLNVIFIFILQFQLDFIYCSCFSLELLNNDECHVEFNSIPNDSIVWKQKL